MTGDAQAEALVGKLAYIIDCHVSSVHYEEAKAALSALAVRLEAAERALTDARYLGDNHHNAAACPHYGDLLGEAQARAVAAETEIEALREGQTAYP